MSGTVIRLRRGLRPVPEVPEVSELQVPNEVYSLIIHAQSAIGSGDLDRADSALELALRRLERTPRSI